LLLDELKHNFRWIRDIFTRDDERLDLMSIIFEARNDDDTQRTHINFEDSIAVLNNEVRLPIVPIIYIIFIMYNIFKMYIGLDRNLIFFLYFT